MLYVPIVAGHRRRQEAEDTVGGGRPASSGSAGAGRQHDACGCLVVQFDRSQQGDLLRCACDTSSCPLALSGQRAFKSKFGTSLNAKFLTCLRMYVNVSAVLSNSHLFRRCMRKGSRSYPLRHAAWCDCHITATLTSRRMLWLPHHRSVTAQTSV